MMEQQPQGSRAAQRYRKQAENMRRYLQMLQSQPTDWNLKFTIPLTEFQAQHAEKVAEAVERGERFVWQGGLLCKAMDILSTGYDMPQTEAEWEENIDGALEIGLGSDMCTGIRIGMYRVENDLLPPLSAVVAGLSPCDGFTMFYQLLAANKRFKDVPVFSIDSPYVLNERSINYSVGEQKRLIHFLENLTHKKLDVDRLRQIIDESNKQYDIWFEYNELRRSVPCPHTRSISTYFWTLCHGPLGGYPLGTRLISEILADAENRVREKKGGIEPEKIRIFWFDIDVIVGPYIAAWLEKECQATVVMDMQTFNPYQPIDTTVLDSMLRGMVQRGYDGPMSRQARSTVENVVADIHRVVNDYHVDLVISPGHMGHKDLLASVGIIREVCREIGVPVLHLGIDLFDPRYETYDMIKKKILDFIEIHGL